MTADKPFTWYEDTRSRILYTCEERYDGSMVAYVLDLQKQLTAAQDELTFLRGKVLAARTVYACEFCQHFPVPVDVQPCDGCSRNPAYPLEGIGTDRFKWMTHEERSKTHDAG